MDAGLDGNYKQGRPVFTLNFEDVTAMEKFWDKYGKTVTHNLPDGTTEDESYLDVNLEGVVTTANAQGEWKSPGSSSADTTAYLEILYYLILENKELPEFLMGTAIASSKASAETQMPPFIKMIEMRQLLCEDWLIELAQLGAAYIRAAGMRRGFAGNAAEIRILWPRLVDNDNRLTLDTLKWALAAGVIDDENAVRLMPVDIENPEAMLLKLRAGAAEREAEAAEDARIDKAIERDAQMWTDDTKMRANGHGNHAKMVVVELN